nr:immunoglobulin heavy chain junction region [Mus musculus]
CARGDGYYGFAYW